MKGVLNGTYLTVQRDLFDSGLVAKIGPNSFAVWNAIKCHANFNTGHSYPGMRSIASKVGLSPASVQRAIACLKDYHLIRIVSPHGKKRGQTYIARERLDVKVGEVVVCTVVMDYIPEKLKETIRAFKKDLEDGKNISSSLVEIIPGEGFVHDSNTGSLKKEIDPFSTHSKRSARAVLDELNKK